MASAAERMLVNCTCARRRVRAGTCREAPPAPRRLFTRAQHVTANLSVFLGQVAATLGRRLSPRSQQLRTGRRTPDRAHYVPRVRAQLSRPARATMLGVAWCADVEGGFLAYPGTTRFREGRGNPRRTREATAVGTKSRPRNAPPRTRRESRRTRETAHSGPDQTRRVLTSNGPLPGRPDSDPIATGVRDRERSRAIRAIAKAQ